MLIEQISDLKCEASLRESEIKHLRQEIKALMDSRNEVVENQENARVFQKKWDFKLSSNKM